MAEADPLAENWFGIWRPAGISQLMMVDPFERLVRIKTDHRVFFHRLLLPLSSFGTDAISSELFNSTNLLGSQKTLGK